MRSAWKLMKGRTSGRKAYAVGAAMIVTALAAGTEYAGFIPEMLTPADPATLLFEGVGLVFLRAGIAKAKPKARRSRSVYPQ